MVQFRPHPTSEYRRLCTPNYVPLHVYDYNKQSRTIPYGRVWKIIISMVRLRTIGFLTERVSRTKSWCSVFRTLLQGMIRLCETRSLYENLLTKGQQLTHQTFFVKFAHKNLLMIQVLAVSYSRFWVNRLKQLCMRSGSWEPGDEASRSTLQSSILMIITGWTYHVHVLVIKIEKIINHRHLQMITKLHF